MLAENAQGARKPAEHLVSALDKVIMTLLTDMEAHNHWITITKEVKSSSKSISETTDINKKRDHFKHLSAHLSKAIKLFEVNQKVYEEFCPMADGNKGAYWLSISKEIKNPYYGKAKFTCGAVTEEIN